MEGRPLEDSELVVKARAGDALAYEALVRRHSDVAFRVAYLVTGNAADAEEAAQDAFVKAHRALGRFRDGEPWRPWLLRIVENEARNRRRSATRRERAHDHLMLAARPGDAAPSPESVAEAREERETLLHALKALPPDDRRVIECRYFLELDTGETAAVIGRPVGTVKSRLARALSKLRAQLEPAHG